MASLYDGLTDRVKIWRGAGRVLIAPGTTTFPAKIEDIINRADYSLEAGWVDLGPTTEDGVKIRREIATFDGIAVDQLKTKLDEGEPENTTMSVEMTLIHTDLGTLGIAWEAGIPKVVNGGVGAVAQHSMALDPPVAFTERLLAVIQQDEVTRKHRALVFRKAIPQVEDEIGISSGEASQLPAKFTCKPDAEIALTDGIFGLVFEERLPTDIPLNEARLLIALYNATAGDDWTDNTGWLSANLAADWFGVTVTGGRVTALNLEDNNLDGDISGFRFSTLAKMIAFDASGNADLAGDLATIFWPVGLETLDLNSTGLTWG